MPGFLPGMKDEIQQLIDYTTPAFMLSLPCFITIQLKPGRIKESVLNL